VVTKDELQRQIDVTVCNTRKTIPLVGSITNIITIDFVANAQLASGGSAAMVYLDEEAVALAAVSQAFYINMGSLLPVHEHAVVDAARALGGDGIPWVLDPVGIGIGTMRARILDKLKDYNPSVIRCNASEAIALAQAWELDTHGARGLVKGVDSTDSVQEARAAALSLARHTGGAVAVSGEVDLVTDGTTVALSQGGSPLMAKVTGFGCSLGGTAAVYAACASPLVAALTATNAYNLAASRAQEQAAGPASFKVGFIDALYNASPEDIASNPFEIEEA
jgi:hydroxyethylthiazole kinase